MKPPVAMIDTVPIPPITPKAAARFLAKVAVRNDAGACRLWTASRNQNGYGQFWVGGRPYLAHRVAWAWANGPIPAGLTLDHICCAWDRMCRGGRSCPHRACTFPEHLEAKPMRDNTLAGKTVAADHAARTHCPIGHELATTNLVAAELRIGKRKCRICGVTKIRARNRSRSLGQGHEEQRTAARNAVAALTGYETPAQIGLAPDPIHYALGLVESQLRFDLRVPA